MTLTHRIETHICIYLWGANLKFGFDPEHQQPRVLIIHRIWNNWRAFVFASNSLSVNRRAFNPISCYSFILHTYDSECFFFLHQIYITKNIRCPKCRNWFNSTLFFCIIQTKTQESCLGSTNLPSNAWNIRYLNQICIANQFKSFISSNSIRKPPSGIRINLFIFICVRDLYTEHNRRTSESPSIICQLSESHCRTYSSHWTHSTRLSVKAKPKHIDAIFNLCSFLFADQTCSD